MKKYLAILLFVTVHGALAQNIRIGIKGGLNLSNFSYYYSSLTRPSDLTPGYHVGALVNFGFKKFDIQPSVMFTSKGDQFTFQFLPYNQTPINIKQTINYIEVPVNVLYHIFSKHGNNLHIGAGPYFAYGLSAKVSDGTNTSDVKFSETQSIMFTPSYKQTDYGFNFIAGALLKNKVIIDAGYGLGLANLTYGNARQNNRAFSFSLGYMFK